MKLIHRMIMFFVTITLIGTISGGIIFLHFGTTALEDRLENQLESVVVLKKNQLNQFLREIEVDMEVISEQKFLEERLVADQLFHSTPNNKEAIYFAHTELIDFFQKIISKEDLSEIMFLDIDGKVHISTNPDQEGKFRNTEPYFIQGKEKTYVQNFFYDITYKEPTIMIATPIKTEEGDTLGVLIGRISTDEVWEIMSESSGIGKGETYLVNKFNLIVSKSRFLEGMEFKKTIHTEGVEKCLIEKGKGLKSYTNYRGEHVVGSWEWLPERELCLMVELNEEEAFRSINQLKQVIFLFAILTTLVVVVAILFLSTRIVRPIQKLKAAAENISRGNLVARVEIKGDEEIEDLSKSFDNMRYSLKMVIEEYEKRKAQEDIIRQLEATMAKQQVTEKRMELINNTMHSLLKARDLQEIYDITQTNSVKITGSDFGLLGIRTSQGLQVVSMTELFKGKSKMPVKEKKFKNLNHLFGRVILDRKPILTNTPAKHKFGKEKLPEGYPKINSFLGVPIFVNGKVVGDICVVNKESGYQLEDQKSLETFAEGIAIIFTRMNAEKKNLKKTNQLKRFVKLAMGREEKMLELKKDIVSMGQKNLAKKRKIVKNEKVGIYSRWNIN